MSPVDLDSRSRKEQQRRVLKDAEISSLIGLAPWAEGELDIRMVPAFLQSNVFHAKGHEQRDV
jgi:hypothetical protein